MKWINRRPDNWFELLAKMLHAKLDSGEEVNAAEIYADAMLSAVVKWLWEKCPHTTTFVANTETVVLGGFEHRYLCPECMKELEGEK